MHRIIPDKAEALEINLPSSKSITHRLFILAALNRGITRIRNPLISEDTQLTRTALENMGAVFEEQDNQLIVSKPIGQVKADDIYLGNSGSSARFLIPLGTFLDQPVRFSGSERLHQRPFLELLEAISGNGKFTACADVAGPFKRWDDLFSASALIADRVGIDDGGSSHAEKSDDQITERDALTALYTHDCESYETPASESKIFSQSDSRRVWRTENGLDVARRKGFFHGFLLGHLCPDQWGKGYSEKYECTFPAG
jgi:hypothetical protein